MPLGTEGKRNIALIIIVIILSAVWLVLPKKVENPKPVTPSPTPISKPEAIDVSFPKPNDEITSPLTVTGQARGTWFFEASFPVVLTDWDGKIIAQGIAQAKSDWMTENFVPFEATLTYIKPITKNNGFLILKKDNPSGLAENDASYEVPVIFKSSAEGVFCTQDVKLCPDGSYVSRTAPNCEFAPCPTP